MSHEKNPGGLKLGLSPTERSNCWVSSQKLERNIDFTLQVSALFLISEEVRFWFHIIVCLILVTPVNSQPVMY